MASKSDGDHGQKRIERIGSRREEKGRRGERKNREKAVPLLSDVRRGLEAPDDAKSFEERSVSESCRGGGGASRECDLPLLPQQLHVHQLPTPQESSSIPPTPLQAVAPLLEATPERPDFQSRCGFLS